MMWLYPPFQLCHDNSTQMTLSSYCNMATYDVVAREQGIAFLAFFFSSLYALYYQTTYLTVLRVLSLQVGFAPKLF